MNAVCRHFPDLVRRSRVNTKYYDYDIAGASSECQQTNKVSSLAIPSMVDKGMQRQLAMPMYQKSQVLAV